MGDKGLLCDKLQNANFLHDNDYVADVVDDVSNGYDFNHCLERSCASRIRPP